jgi:SOS-response transcriptional repressor LexA
VKDSWKIILDFIRAYTKKHGVPPSYAVLAEGLGMKSKGNMHRIVKKLEELGYVQTKPRKFYSIRIVDRSIEEVTSL